MSRADGEPEEDGDVAELLRLAGSRRAVSDESLARLRETAHRDWRHTVGRRRLQSRATMVLGLLGVAAALFWVLDVPSVIRTPVARPLAGVVDHVTGDVRDLTMGTALGSGARLRPGTSVATTKGTVSVAWHDGARVRLDAHTRVQVEPDALVLESGGLYVTADPAGPLRSRFVVTTSLGTTSHVGTRYEVRMGEGALRVRVRDGAVRVQRADAVHTAAAGEEVTVHDDGAVARRAVSTYGADWSWITTAGPPFRMDGRSARALVEWAAAESGWTLRFSDPSVADLAARTTLHGTVEGLSPEEALAAVLPTCGLEHRVDEGRLVVQRRPAR